MHARNLHCAVLVAQREHGNAANNGVFKGRVAKLRQKRPLRTCDDAGRGLAQERSPEDEVPMISG
eukprot:2719243-Pyramimonas_sp.AAC.1